MLREPAVIAKWLLIIDATGLLALLIRDAAGADVILRGIPLLAWVVGPAALAALLVARTRSREEAWLFVGAEAATLVSTAWLCALVFLNTGSRSAQSGTALLLLSSIQLVALLLLASGVKGTALIFRKRSAWV